MKNKTKKQKIKKQAVSVPEGPRYWFYMSPDSTGVRAIHDCLKEMDAVQTEIWEEAGVLEVILPEGHSMDIETGRPDLKDEYSKRFLEEHQVKYENRTKHAGRRIRLTYMVVEAPAFEVIE